jgi:formate hydrogenlyase subunit 6/NADH:ubiquinone oxidoreductase subunit I
VKKLKAELRFNNKRVAEPIISTVVLKEQTNINILKAHVNESGGKVLIEIPNDKAEQVIKAFRESGVEVKLEILAEITEDCIHCGYCITLCPVEAIIYNKEDLTVKMSSEKCIQCGRCVDACPTKAIRIWK